MGRCIWTELALFGVAIAERDSIVIDHEMLNSTYYFPFIPLSRPIISLFT